MSSTFRALERPTVWSLLRDVAIAAVLVLLFFALRASQHEAELDRAAARRETGTVTMIDQRREEIVVDDDPDCRSGLTPRSQCRTRMIDRYFVSYAYGAAREYTGRFEAHANVRSYLQIGGPLPVLVDPANPQVAEPEDHTLVSGGTLSGRLLVFMAFAGVAAALAVAWLLWTVKRMVT